jgi:hypothetical protein
VQVDLDRRDLVSEDQQQHPPLRGQPLGISAGQLERVQQPGRGVTVQVARGQPDVVLGQQRTDPALERGGQLQQLPAVPDQLAQLPQVRWGDVGLR